jgi:hypothetical protein
MLTDSSLILCSHHRQFLRQISSRNKKLPHPLQCSNKIKPNSKIFTPRKMKFWKRSVILTLPLPLALPKLCSDAVRLHLHHLSTITKRSIVLTLPLLISSHMLRLLIALVNAYLLLRHAHLSPRTASPPGRACAQARSPSSVQNFTCPKSPLTRFQF